jgi:hypothetical protein
MSTLLQNNFSNTRQNAQYTGLLFLLFISAIVLADDNIIFPPAYRTPLSDMVYDDHKEWRTGPEEQNPWREKEDKILFKPRTKAEFFPQYQYDRTRGDSQSDLFYNEGTQQERPVPNIFKYTF